MRRSGLLLLTLAFVVVVAGWDSAATAATTSAVGSGLAISVSGNQFVNQNGDVVQLRGVNRPGTEYSCVDDLGFTTGATGSEGQNLSYAATVASSLLDWNVPGASENAINAVRVPLNEDCWLGINGAPSAYSGANYQAFIEDEVSDLTAQGMYVVLDLHWSAPDTLEAVSQNVAPDEDHSVTFWQEVATTFKDDPAVMFDLYNEPHVWCYTSACSSSYTFQTAGTQQLVTTIRATGAKNVILIEGLGWANAVDNWVKYLPTDPDNQLAAEIHTYPSSGMNVNNFAYLNATLADGGLSSNYPIYVGEFGEQICSGNSTGFTENTMDWADANGYSYTAWGWDAGEGCGGPSLVTDDDTGATTTYGSIVEAHLRALDQSSLLTPGTMMTAGQGLLTSDGQYRLTMQSDGNLVEYNASNSPIWASGTNGHAGAYAIMQDDGNLVVYSSADAPLWASNTNGNAGAYLSLGGYGALVVEADSGQPLWGEPDLLTSGKTLTAGQEILTPDGQYRLIMQSDGNLVEYNNSSDVALWASHTNGHAGAYAIMQGDGNLVVYSSADVPLWASNTDGYSGAYLSLGDDGTLAVVDATSGSALWTA